LRDVDRGEPNYLEANLAYCHFVHHKSDVVWPVMKLGLLRQGAGNCMSPGMAIVNKCFAGLMYAVFFGNVETLC
jgi:hypothetical protein